MSSYLAKQQAYKEDPEAFEEGQYFGASMMPGTGEAIAAYELPGILSQAKTLMQDPNALKALAGLTLGALGTAAVAPGIGPLARGAKKGLEGFIPYLQPKLAPAGGPDTSKVLMSGDDGDDLFSLPPAGGTYEPGQKKVIKGLNQEIYKLTDKSLFDPAKKAGRKLVIVSCSQKKCPDVGNMKAFDRYMGSVFQSLKKQGVPEDVDVAILSAKHGLISRDTPIKNYDLKMSSEIGQKFKSDPTQMNRMINTMTGYDDVIVQGGPLYKDVIRAAAGKGDVNLTEVPPGGGIGTQRSDLVKLIKGEEIAKGKGKTQKLTDEDYFNQLEDMDVNYVDVLPSGNKIERQFRFDAVLDDKDEVLTQAIPAFTLKSILKLGENLKGADKKRAISDRIDQIKPVVKDNLDLQKERYLYFINKTNTKSDSYNLMARGEVKSSDSLVKYYARLLDDLNKVQKTSLGNAYNKNLAVHHPQNYKGGDAKSIFKRIDTPVYHFSINIGGPEKLKGFTKFNEDKLGFYDFGPHVASTPKAAEDRYISQVGGIRDKDGQIIMKSDAEGRGGTLPLMADLSKPFNNPKTGKPFTEDELIDYKVEQINNHPFGPFKNKTFTRDDLLLETDNFDVKDIRSAVNSISRKLASKGFTHVPYVNSYEDVGNLSYEMLINRAVGDTKVLQGKFAKKDTAAASDPDFMKAEGGVVEMKDKAVNMYRDAQGIEPFIKYMV